MIKQNDIKKQLPNEIYAIFSELNVFTHLRQAGITKQKGYETAYLFTVLFSLVFKGKSLNQVLNSREAEKYVGKDCFYRFMNKPSFNWRRFLVSLSTFVISKTHLLTNSKTQIRALVVDDTSYYRDRSKKVNKLAWQYDRALNKGYKGYRLLTLGFTDGHSFFPVDFSLLSGKKKVSTQSQVVDRRTSGGKRLIESERTAVEVTIEMIERALNQGIYATHVLMDKWFTSPKLIHKINELGIDVIGMVMNNHTKYWYNGQLFRLSELVGKSVKETNSSTILSSIRVSLQTGEAVKIVFVKNHNKKSE